MQDTTDTTNLSRCLIHQISPRGGDNYWARVINGTDKVYLETEGTLAVSIAHNGRYILTCHNPFFDKCSAPMQKLAVIHEAGHLALRHLERVFRLLAQVSDPLVRAAVITTFNWAADLAVNDSILRNEKEFSRVHKPMGSKTGEWTFLLPEELGLPRGKSMDEYIRLLLKDLPKIRNHAQQLMESLGKAIQQTKSDEPDDSEDAEETPNTESREADGAGDTSGPSTKSKKPGRGKKSNGSTPADDDDPMLPPGISGMAQNDPGTFEFLQKVFDELNHSNHKGWNDIAKKMTSAESASMGNKLKQHARRLVRTAHEQTKRLRGFVPDNVENLVRGLLEPEQVPWNWIFQDAMASAVSSRVIEAMAMPNISLLNEDHVEPWPGNMLDFQFNITWLTDTSGSVNDTEYARACNELNALLNVNKSVRVTYMECDAAIQKEVEISNLQAPDDDELATLRKRRGYGGTVYTPAFKRILGVDTPQDWCSPADRPEELPPRPDLLVVYTDGGVGIQGEVFPQYHPGCPIIWLVAPDCSTVSGMNDTAPDRVIHMFHVKAEFE